MKRKAYKYFNKIEPAYAFQKEALKKSGIYLVLLERTLSGKIRAIVSLDETVPPDTISWLGTQKAKFNINP